MKAARILREATGKRKEPVDTQIDLDIFSAVDSLGHLHKLARRSIRSELGALWNQCSLYISRIVLAKEDSSEAVVAVYCASLDDYMMRKASAFPQKYIIDFLKRFPEAAVKLFDTLANYAKGTAQVNAFRRIQAIEMMSTLLTSANGLVSVTQLPLLPCTNRTIIPRMPNRSQTSCPPSKNLKGLSSPCFVRLQRNRSQPYRQIASRRLPSSSYLQSEFRSRPTPIKSPLSGATGTFQLFSRRSRITPGTKRLPDFMPCSDKLWL